MNILIINPPSPEFIRQTEKRLLLGPLYLAAALRRAGHTVSYLDGENAKIRAGGEYRLEGFLAMVEQHLHAAAPAAVALSVHFSGIMASSLAVARRVKSWRRSCPVILGGHHPTIFACQLLAAHPEFDYILKGESEGTLTELLAALAAGGDPAPIDGLVWRDGGGTVRENDKKTFIAGVDELPYPAYDMVNLRDYEFDASAWFNPKKHAIRSTMPVLTSRSCPCRCTFCSMYLMHGPRYRMRSAAAVVAELRHWHDTYGQQYFSIVDDNFTLDKARTLAICDGISRAGLDIQFDATNGAAINTIDREVMDALTGVGFVRTFFAVENASEQIRRGAMKKNLSQEKLYEVFDLLPRYKDVFQYTVLFIIGYPEETRATLEENYEFIRRYQFRRAAIGFAVPYPGTELHDRVVREGLLTVPAEELPELPALYNFARQPLIRPYALATDELVEFRERVYHDFNLRHQQKTAF